MDKWVIHFDGGHGTRIYTPFGKQSPDGRLYEGEWDRTMVDRLVPSLQRLNLDVRKVVPEPQDISLQERCNRVNDAVRREPHAHHIFISIHINAAAKSSCDKDGWCDAASGVSVYVCNGASEESRKLAKAIYGAAKEFGLQGNRSVPKEGYWSANFKVLRGTNCPAILIENLFMTNRAEVDFLLSEKGQETIENMIIVGLCRYLGIPAPVIWGERSH